MSTTIFQAKYSNVPVYEMPCKGVAVMRRKADAWLNATQILKVAGFDKPQRTRVLEREVQKGTHEKVQGGYGKYQGTWVPPERGLALAQQYGVDHLLTPIIDYVPAAESPPQAPKHITSASVSRPKKQKADPDADQSTPSRPTARQSAVQARATAQAQLPVQQPVASTSTNQTRARQVPYAPAERVRPQKDRSFSPTASDASSRTRTPSPIDSAISDYNPANGQNKKRKTDTGQAIDVGVDYSAGIGPARYARLILDYFVSESAQIPQFLISPPSDFDANVVIDDDGHTALHWACAMGRIRIVRLLLTAGADIFRANAIGQTALMRSVMFTNNYDLRKFPELFELLHRSTINIDRNDRTVFHYVVDIALQKGKTHAARYYLETILARLAEYPREIADILNFQDEEGETSLTLAARARSRSLVKLLLDHGADPKVANKEGKTAEDYVMEDERFRQPDGNSGLDLGSTLPLHLSETAKKISTSAVPQMSQMLETLASAFDTDLREKENDVLQANTMLATIQTEVADAQKLAASMQGGTLNLTNKYNEIKTRELQLEAELKEKMGRRFRAGWESFMREQEQQRMNGMASAELAQLYQIPTQPEQLQTACDQARSMISVMQEEKRDLFDEYVHAQADSGASQKMGDYRKLLSMGTGLPIADVDSVIDSLAEHLEETQPDGLIG